jgi:hypothetical protein
MNDRQTQWITWLHIEEWWYNNTYHTSTKMSLFEALYGYPPPSIKEYVINSKVPDVKYYLAMLDEVLCTLKSHLEQEMNRMKQQDDKRRTNKEFTIVDWVFVRLQPYKYNSLKTYKKQKLAPNFYGPYQIRRRIGQFSYALDIPNKGKLHDVFHVSCLKKKLGPTIHIQTDLPLLDEGKLVLLLKGRYLRSSNQIPAF